MYKDSWLEVFFNENTLPEWGCPYCNKSILVEADFRFNETILSRNLRKTPNWFFIDVIYSCNGILRCTNCGEYISFVGSGKLDIQEIYDMDSGRYSEIEHKKFRPLFFFPALNYFELTEECPSKINDVIQDSFSLFWSDLSSCANKIRIALELLMDDRNINRTKTIGGKRTKLNLHRRIELYKVKEPEIADFLLAIKWIGNVGSHVGDLKRIDILEAYEMLEHTLNKIYDDKEKRLKEISKKIIKRRGTIKR